MLDTFALLQKNAPDSKFNTDVNNLIAEFMDGSYPAPNRVKETLASIPADVLNPKPPVVVDPSLTKEWKPTEKNAKLDQLKLGYFDLTDILMTAQKNLKDIEGANPVNWNQLGLAKADVKKAQKAKDDFITKNPDATKTSTPELQELMLAYTTRGFNIPTEIKNAARDMIGGFWDGVYPPKNDVNAMIKKLQSATPIPAPVAVATPAPAPVATPAPAKVKLEFDAVGNLKKRTILKPDGTVEKVEDIPPPLANGISVNMEALLFGDGVTNK